MKINIKPKGFSLVEMMVAVAIVTALSGVAYFGVQATRSRLMNSKVTADLLGITNALEQYKVDHDARYPIPAPGSNTNVLCFEKNATYADGPKNRCSLCIWHY